MATTITTQPTRDGANLIHSMGDVATLNIEATVESGDGGLTVQWFKDDETFGAARSIRARRGVVSDTVTFDVVDAADAGTYHAAITDRVGTTLVSEAVELTVQSADDAPARPASNNHRAVPADEPTPLLVYDQDFAKKAAVILGALFVLIIVPVYVVEGRKGISELTLAWVVSLALLLIGVVIALVGSFMILLEVRGHILTVDEHAALHESGVSAKSALNLDKVTSIVEAFGRLRGPLAVLAMSAAPLLGSAWVAHDSGRPVVPTVGTVGTGSNQTRLPTITAPVAATSTTQPGG
jgi:hypothetical protein